MSNQQAQSFYIKTLHLKNFKKFRCAEIKFSKGLNFLIGPNNAGKSTILEAIDIAIGGKWLSEEIIDSSFFLEGEKDFLICAEIDFPKVGGSANKSRINFIRNLKLSKGGGRSILNGSYTNATLKDIFEGLEIDDKVYDSVGESGSDIERIYFISSAKIKDDGVYAIENYVWIDFKDPMTKGPGFGMEEKYKSVKIYMSRQVKNDLVSFLFIPAARSENKQLFQIAPHTWLGKYLRNLQKEDGEKIEEFFSSNLKNLFPIQPSEPVTDVLNKLLGDNNKLSINSFDNKHSDILFKYAHIFLEDPFFAEIEKKGHGVQSAVAIALFSGLLAQDAGNRPGYGTPRSGSALEHWATILELEEPESHFHPPIRSKLICLLKKKFVDFGAQVIFSTHDDGFVRWPYANGSNFIFPSAINDNEVCSFEFLETEYGTQPKDDVNSRILRFQSQTIFSEKVLIVEGCEAVCLDSMFMRLFGDNFGSDSIAIAQSVDSRPRTSGGDGGNLNPGGGSSQIPDTVNVYKKLNIKSACLIDIDCLFNGSIAGIIESFEGKQEEFNFSEILSWEEIKRADGKIISAQEMREKIKSNEEKEKLYEVVITKLSKLGIFIYEKGDFEGNFKNEFVKKFIKEDKIIKEALAYAVKREAEVGNNFEDICLNDGAVDGFRKILESCNKFF